MDDCSHRYRPVMGGSGFGRSVRLIPHSGYALEP